MKRNSAVAAAAAAVIASVTLSACGTDEGGHGSGHGSGQTGTTSTSSTTARQGDITFAQQMIPHHRQAVQMADMALDNKSASPDVTALATGIKKAQDPEITTMSGWLRTWGASVPSPGDHSGHDMGKMGGMMSAKDMAALGKATGPAFDRMWLTMMIKHHQGAVTMSNDVKKTTTNPDVTNLANTIIKGQNAEIRTMQGLLAPA